MWHPDLCNLRYSGDSRIRVIRDKISIERSRITRMVRIARMSDMLAAITNQSDFTAKFDRAPARIESPEIADRGLPSAMTAEVLK